MRKRAIGRAGVQALRVAAALCCVDRPHRLSSRVRPLSDLHLVVSDPSCCRAPVLQTDRGAARPMVVVDDSMPVPLLMGLRRGGARGGDCAGIALELGGAAFPVAKVRRPVALRPADSSTRLQPLKAAPSQLALAPSSRSGAERLHAGLSSGRQGQTSPLLSRARTAPAARPATSQAVSDMVELVAARQAEEELELQEQGMSMAGMSVGDFVEEAHHAEQKLRDEQEAEREANDHARNLKFCYGRVDQLLESLGETHPSLIVKGEDAPKAEVLELPPRGPGAHLLQLLRESDERKQVVMDGLLAQLDKGAASCQQMHHTLAASLALSREQLADLEKGMAEDIYELAELIDNLVS